MQPIQFAIVGGGWRAEFYLRIAKALPDRFQIVGMVVRDADKGRAIEQRWGVSTYRSISDLLAAAKPHFVVACVSWDSNPGVCRELAERDLPILSETPPARDVALMKELCQLVAQGARIQVAEQYIYQPHHAARLAFARSGLIGRVTQAQVSAAHGYHGVSLIRHFLGVAYDKCRITAKRFTSPLMAGPDRNGPPTEPRSTPSTQTIAWLDWGSRLGVFDFTGDQYFSWVRGQRLLVRGDRGEINNHTANYLRDYLTPIEVVFQRKNAGPNGNLEGFYLKGIIAGERWWYANPTAPGRLSDDEIAIATSLIKMAEYVAGGPEVYPLAQACQDRYLDMMIEQAATTGQVVEAEAQEWQT